MTQGSLAIDVHRNGRTYHDPQVPATSVSGSHGIQSQNSNKFIVNAMLQYCRIHGRMQLSRDGRVQAIMMYIGQRCVAEWRGRGH